MAQMAESRETPRPQYSPHEYSGYGGQTSQQSPQQRSEASREDSRSSYPPPDQARQGQYPTAPSPYPPPQHWAGHPHGAYPPPPQHYDPNHPPYHYPPPSTAQPSQPMQPDPYRLPPPHPPYGYYAAPPYQPPPAPAPRQRTAIACKYCRKRKIRCSGYDSSPDGRCQNCVRFNQQCLFHPVSSQAAFVPASAVYGPNARAPMAGQGDGQGQNGQPQQPMLYGAHGQPLGPAGPGGQPQYNYPPPAPTHGYGPPHYAYPPPGQYPVPPHVGGPPPPHYDHGPPPASAGPQSDRSDRSSLKRGPPDDEPHDENQGVHSPHPNSKPRHSAYDGRTNSNSSYDYGHQAPTSPATSTMSYQSYPPPAHYTNGAPPPVKATNSPPQAGLTPQSAHSFNSPHGAQPEGKTPPPNQPGSAGSSQNGRSGMKVHEMLGGPNPHGPLPEQRGKSDNEMLNKLDGKK